MKTDIQKKMKYFMNQYLKYNNQVNYAENMYKLKLKTSMDFGRIVAQEKIHYLQAKRTTALRLWVQFIKENL